MVRRTSIYQLGLTFFGLTQSDRINVYRQIHEIVFHGNGGYDWSTVYNMPIWLRNYTFNLLNDYYINKNKPQETVSNKDTQIVVPDYVTKTPKN